MVPNVEQNNLHAGECFICEIFLRTFPGLGQVGYTGAKCAGVLADPSGYWIHMYRERAGVLTDLRGYTCIESSHSKSLVFNFSLSCGPQKVGATFQDIKGSLRQNTTLDMLKRAGRLADLSEYMFIESSHQDFKSLVLNSLLYC